MLLQTMRIVNDSCKSTKKWDNTVNIKLYGDLAFKKIIKVLRLEFFLKLFISNLLFE